MTEEAESTNPQIVVKMIPKGTDKEKIEEHFKKFDGEVKLYKARAKTPFAFVELPQEKLEEALAAELKFGETVCEVSTKVPLMKYFVETQTTDGDLQKIGEEKLKEYFETKGTVFKLNLVKDKEFGFLEMVKGNDDEAEDLAWHTHTIEGQVVNVKEHENTRKRKYGGRGRSGGKRRRGRGRGRR